MQPRFMVEFNQFPIDDLPPLVLDAAAGITMAMVIRRDEKRADIEHSNRQKALQSDYAYTEYNNALFSKIEASLYESAPLLLSKLKADYPIAGCLGMFDGPKAYRAIVAMQHAGNAFDHKQHDEVHHVMQTKKPADDVHPDAWAAHINEFRRNHYPHLERPMTAVMLGKFIINYLPAALGADARLMLNSLSDTDLADTSKVVDKCMIVSHHF